MKGLRIKYATVTGRTCSAGRQEHGQRHQRAGNSSDADVVCRGPGGNGEWDPFRKIEQSIAYMMQHLDEPLQVRRLAALVNVSPSHYFALFKRRTGCAPIDFFIHLRMYRACQLLDATALSVKEVAAALGYDDPFYFSRVFKSVNQVAPTEYRSMDKAVKDSVRRGGIGHHFSLVAESLSRPERAGLGAQNHHAASMTGRATVAGLKPAEKGVLA